MLFKQLIFVLVSLFVLSANSANGPIPLEDRIDLSGLDTAEYELLLEGVTERPTIEVPSDEVVELASHIVAYKRRMGGWVECGEMHHEDELAEVALEWSSAIIKALEKNVYKYRGKMIHLDMEEAIGVMMHESRLDRCAVGPYPRKFAYNKGLLKRKKNTISHSMEEWESVFKHKGFKKRDADLGPGQIVHENVGSMSWQDIKDIMSVNPGVDKVFAELALRGRMYRTASPSGRWPGRLNHPRYTFTARRTGRSLLSAVNK